MKIDEGVNGKIHAKVRQMLNSKAKTSFQSLEGDPVEMYSNVKSKEVLRCYLMCDTFTTNTLAP